MRTATVTSKACLPLLAKPKQGRAGVYSRIPNPLLSANTKLHSKNIFSLSQSLSSFRLTPCPAVGRTAFSVETNRLTKLILTRQAVKTLLNYLSETNGELHFWLHQYVAENPIALDARVDPDEWLVQLACYPLTKVLDPRRSSTVSAAAAAAVMNGEREVSPREVAQRILGLRDHIAKEMVEDLANIAADNSMVLRKTLQKTTKEPDLKL